MSDRVERRDYCRPIEESLLFTTFGRSLTLA
jgi:hypothetical protein